MCGLCVEVRVLSPSSRGSGAAMHKGIGCLDGIGPGPGLDGSSTCQVLEIGCRLNEHDS